MSPATIIISLLLGFPALMIVYYLFYEPLRILFRLNYLNSSAKLTTEDINILEKNFSFYKQLSTANKDRFERRIVFFLHYKKYTGDEIKVTEEMRLMIAACAIQLTFGLRNFWLTDFDEIVIEDDSYYLKDYDVKAMGHISPHSGTITLSWKNLQDGITNANDGINVGLHEMAHALMISSTQKGWNLSFAAEYDNWEKDASKEWYEKKEAGEFFRDYAYTNLYEFFAVAVEYFFERPKDFSEQEPLLYTEMKRLLRLDPMNVSDPILHSLPHAFPSQKIPLPRHGVSEVIKMPFTGVKNFIYFLIGSIATVYAIKLLYMAFSSNSQNASLATGLNAAGAGIVLLIALFFFIQLFYTDKELPSKNK